LSSSPHPLLGDDANSDAIGVPRKPGALNWDVRFC
jgi:hypothetical protein